jgi:apolipoprotein N-acyltransferase
VLLPLAFSPFDLFPLAILAPAALFYTWCDGSPARAAWRGFLFGLGMFGVGVSWVYVSMHNFGNMPAPLAAFVTALFVAGLALYPAVLGYLQGRLFQRDGVWRAILLLPSLWVLFEWLRGWFLPGFPWLNLGYSQVDSSLGGYAPLVGVYGMSLIVAVSAGFIVECLRTPERRTVFLLMLAALWLAGFGLARIEWAEPQGQTIHAALVQGNVPLREKWDPLKRTAILERYRQLSVVAPHSELIVWPEAALPVALHQIDPGFLAGLREFARKHGTDFLIGVIERDENQRDYYNSVIALGSAEGVYRKRHLVPFGEYIPFKPLFLWFMNSFQIPMSDLRPGPASQPPLTAAGHAIGVSVCYEDAFGEELIHALPQATMLVNLSEDAWFGDSLAPHQRLQMARLRALETARPMLRAANTGPSAAIDHRGSVIARSPPFRQVLLVAEVQPMRGATPYVRWGNLPVILVAAVLLTLGGFSSWCWRANTGRSKGS